MTAYFAEILKSYREEKGLTQTQLAHELGISRTYLSQIEREKAINASFDLGLRILNLWQDGHGQIEVTLSRRVKIDAAIAPEVVWLNSQGIVTEGSCIGPPPAAVIRPSSAKKVRELGYEPIYLGEGVGLFEITLKSGM